MRVHGFLLSSEPAKRGPTSLLCYDGSSTCHAPKGAAARCCSVVALGRARKERLWHVAPFFLGPIMEAEPQFFPEESVPCQSSRARDAAGGSTCHSRN
jgi:hypothetical protein